MAIQNIITGDFKIRNENGILIAVDGIVFADTSGTIGTSGTSGTSGSSTILYGTSGSVIVIPSTPTTTTTAAPTTTTTTAAATTTTTDGPYYYYIANQYTCPDCTTIVATGIIIKSYTTIASGYWVEGLGSIMYNLTNTSAPNPSAILVNGNVATPTCPCTTTTTTAAPATTTTTIAFTSFYLQFSSLSQANACAIYPGDLNQYFIAFGASLQNGTILYSDSALTTPVINGYYSDGSKSWLTASGNGVLANETSCTTTTTTTVAPTTTTTTAAATTTTTTFAAIPMIMTFNVANNGDSITLPYENDPSYYSGTINWGDGTVVSNNYANRTHTYAIAGNYDVTITGVCKRFNFNGLSTSANRLKDIKQWGIVDMYFNTYMFRDCSNLTGISAIDTPIFGAFTNLEGMFFGCTLLGTTTTNMNSWDLSNVISVRYMFYACINFNSNISSWNVSNISNFVSMFNSATLFNQNISSWNVSGATNMSQMFNDAYAFNQNIGSWNVSNVTDMSSLFAGCIAFNQNISNWNVANVTDMTNMFVNAYVFNQDLSHWCVTNIPTAPTNFSLNATAWSLPKPVWGTCPG